MTMLSTRCGGRRPKSAKARNRGKWGTAASMMVGLAVRFVGRAAHRLCAATLARPQSVRVVVDVHVPRHADTPVCRRGRKPPARRSSKPAARTSTKHDRIIAMLRTPAGATIASLVTATEWQQHSVRGFLAGVVRKKLGLNLVSETGDKGRVYRIRVGKAAPAAVGQVKQAS